MLAIYLFEIFIPAINVQIVFVFKTQTISNALSNVLSRNRVQVQKCPSSYDTKDKFVTDGLEKETLPCLLKTYGKRKLHTMPRYARLYKAIRLLTYCICTCHT